MAKRKKAKAKPAADDLVGKRVQFDRATWDAVDLLAREQMKDLAEITEEAFRDLLKKYGPLRRLPRVAENERAARGETARVIRVHDGT